MRVITPRYRSIRERKFGLREVARLRCLPICIGDREYECAVKSGFIPGSKVQVYFIENSDFFERNGYYTNPDTDSDWHDNHLRFAFLNHTSLQLMQHLQWFPDIIHCNDWQTALVPYLLNTDDQYKADFSGTRTLIHLHNVGYLGLFPLETATELNIREDDYQPGKPFDYFGRLSFLKAGISMADIIVTVSPTYAREIQSSDDLSSGLNGLFASREKSLFGILNGVDTQVWNPSSDKSITKKFEIHDVVQSKKLNKTALQKRLKLPVDSDIPIVGLIARMVDQKGFDLLSTAEKQLMSLPAQYVFLGVGEERYEDMLRRWMKEYPGKVSATFEFNDDLAHQIEAGADMYLMPSKYEPCGLNQMYSLLYGTVPIVRSTGGLADTVIDYNENNNKGNGFAFKPYTGEALMDALQCALELYRNRSEWQIVQQRGMEADFSWESSAQKLFELYQEALAQQPHVG